jgi:hypothetical protein
MSSYSPLKVIRHFQRGYTEGNIVKEGGKLVLLAYSSTLKMEAMFLRNVD